MNLLYKAEILNTPFESYDKKALKTFSKMFVDFQ